jgi:hypothetical protein
MNKIGEIRLNYQKWYLQDTDAPEYKDIIVSKRHV